MPRRVARPVVVAGAGPQAARSFSISPVISAAGQRVRSLSSDPRSLPRAALRSPGTDLPGSARGQRGSAADTARLRLIIRVPAPRGPRRRPPPAPRHPAPVREGRSPRPGARNPPRTAEPHVASTKRAAVGAWDMAYSSSVRCTLAATGLAGVWRAWGPTRSAEYPEEPVLLVRPGMLHRAEVVAGHDADDAAVTAHGKMPEPCVVQDAKRIRTRPRMLPACHRRARRWRGTWSATGCPPPPRIS